MQFPDGEDFVILVTTVLWHPGRRPDTHSQTLLP